VKYILKNNFLEIAATTLGAELTNILFLEENIELLWHGKSEICEIQCPVLFPNIASLVNNETTIENKKYSLPLHGFAMHSEFKLKSSSYDTLIFSLVHNDNTFIMYPYKFELEVKYQLIENTVYVEYVVNNLDNKTIYFSLGGHPTFNCPLYIGENFEDYYIEFEEKEIVSRMMMEGPYMSGEEIPFLNNQKVLPLSKKLFDTNAIILQNITSNKVTLKSFKNKREIIINLNKNPYLALFSYYKNELDSYICIEPWHGLPDYKEFKDSFKDKKGSISLASNEHFTCNFSIQIN